MSTLVKLRKELCDCDVAEQKLSPNEKPEPTGVPLHILLLLFIYLFIFLSFLRSDTFEPDRRRLSLTQLFFFLCFVV